MTVSAHGRRSGAERGGHVGDGHRPASVDRTGQRIDQQHGRIERRAVGAQAVAIALADALDVAEPRRHPPAPAGSAAHARRACPGRGRSRWPPLTRRPWRGRSRRGGDRKWWSPSSFEPAPLYRPWAPETLITRSCGGRGRGVATSTATSRAARSIVPIDTLRHVLDVLGPPPEPDAPPPVYVLREGQDPWRHDLPPWRRRAAGRRRRVRAAGRAAWLAAAWPARARAAGSRGAADRRAAHGAPAGRAAGVGARGAAVRAAVGRVVGHRRPRRPRRLPAATGEPGFVLLSPLHAPALVPPVQPSPYYASSRRARNPLHLAVEEVPEVAALDPAGRAEFDALAAEGRALYGAAADRPRRGAAGQGGGAADGFRPRRRIGRRRWRRSASGRPTPTGSRPSRCWRGDTAATGACWPDALRDPDGAAVARLLRDEARRDRLPRAGCSCWPTSSLAAVPPMRLGVVTDLAVGTAPGGYDHWLRQGMVADRLSVGAPPDPLGPAGQDWGLPPLLPDALTADGYARVRGRSAGEHGARRRHPDRPRDGPVPAVRAAGRRARRRPAPTSPTRPATCCRCWRSRAAARAAW